MNSQLVYKCEITGYLVEYIIQKDLAYMNTIMYDYSSDSKNIKLWFQLIKNSIESLKKNNIKYIVQTVSLDDYNNFLKKDFQLKNKFEAEGICEIQSPIENFLDNFSKGMDLDLPKN